MKEIKIESSIYIYDSLDDLPKHIYDLMQNAFQARDKAYAPYSNFHVGAAIRLDSGKIITGSNQENASYPSGLCAERTAIYFAGAQYPKAKIKQIAISAKSNNKITDKPIAPCGACRQAIADYEIKQKQPIEIYFMGETGEVAMSKSLLNLLPLTFDNSVL